MVYHDATTNRAHAKVWFGAHDARVAVVETIRIKSIQER